MERKNWRITIGRNHYWLTDKEKDFYLGAISQGKEYVALPSGKILARNFLDIVSQESIDEAEHIDAGEWKCEHGVWHKGTCHCGEPLLEYDFIGNVAVPRKRNKDS